MIPMFLYHYTTMESVLAILRNKTIRFTRLDSLNDLNEGCCGEYAHLKKYVYVSSWSADERESIPMWSLYGKKGDVLDEGVRIKVPSNLFSFDEDGNLRDDLKIEKMLGGWNVLTDVKTKPIKKTEGVINSERSKEFFEKVKVIGPMKMFYIPFLEYREKYTDVLKPEIPQNIFSFSPQEIGYEKVDDWAYENEYRFLIHYPNFPKILGGKEALKKEFDFTEEPFIDVYFNKNAIPEMEIKLAPRFNESKIDAFKKELKKLGFTKDLQKSALNVRV